MDVNDDSGFQPRKDFEQVPIDVALKFRDVSGIEVEDVAGFQRGELVDTDILQWTGDDPAASLIVLPDVFEQPFGVWVDKGEIHTEIEGIRDVEHAARRMTASDFDDSSWLARKEEMAERYGVLVRYFRIVVEKTVAGASLGGK